MRMNKKGGVFDMLSGLGIGLAGLVIVFAVVFLIMSNVKSNTQVAANVNATKAATTIMQAADDIPGWVPLVCIALIGGLLIFLVSRFGQGGGA
jgi:di/tricarboxylate transporter